MLPLRRGRHGRACWETQLKSVNHGVLLEPALQSCGGNALAKRCEDAAVLGRAVLCSATPPQCSSCSRDARRLLVSLADLHCGVSERH